MFNLYFKIIFFIFLEHFIFPYYYQSPSFGFGGGYSANANAAPISLSFGGFSAGLPGPSFALRPPKPMYNDVLDAPFEVEKLSTRKEFPETFIFDFIEDLG
jgi:hypothetical protein